MATKTVTERESELQARISGLPDSPSASVRRLATRKRLVNELLLLQVGSAQMAEFLEAQREVVRKNPKLAKLPHVAPHVLRDRLSRKVSNRFYNVQKAFSLPQDYVVFPDGPVPESWESKAIRECVIHPEMVPSEFLRSLGFDIPIAKGAKSNGYVREIEAKIAVIPALKDMLSNSKPIAKTGNGSSRAFALLGDAESPDGRIVAFQDANSRESKRRNSLNTYAKTYSDAYAYLRSRYYAADFLSEREIALKSSATSLSTLIISYDAAPRDAEAVRNIRDELAGRKTFFEQRAYLDRLLGVELRNRSQDRLRIKGALADVQKAFLERMGKRLSMESQAKSVEASVEAEGALWKALYKTFHSVMSEESDVFAKAKRIAGAVEAYEMTGGDFPVRPFSALRATLSAASEGLSSAMGHGDSAEVSHALRNLDCLLRSQAFWLFCFGTEHAFKTDSVMDGVRGSEKLSTVVDRKLARIESMVFGGLDEEAAKSPRFTSYLAKINEMRRLSDREEYGALVEYLEGIRSAL